MMSRRSLIDMLDLFRLKLKVKAWSELVDRMHFRPERERSRRRLLRNKQKITGRAIEIRKNMVGSRNRQKERGERVKTR